MWWIVLLVILMLALALFAFWIFAIAPRTKDRPSFDNLKKFDYAHRGFHNKEKGIPENSMAAFKAAVDNGYGMEFDLQLTKDKKVVIHHDNSLKRICGVDKLISNLTYNELKEIKLYDTQEVCPLFSDVLTMVNGSTPLIIELKPYNNVKELCEYAWDILKDYKGDYCIESFNPTIVEWFKENQPQVIRGQLMGHFVGGKGQEIPNHLVAFLARNMFSNIIARPDFEAYDYKYRDNPALRLCKKLFKIQEVSWTVRDIETHKKLKAEGCISIFENFEA